MQVEEPGWEYWSLGHGVQEEEDDVAANVSAGQGTHLELSLALYQPGLQA